MNARTAARLGWSLFPLCVILWVIALVLNLRRTQDSRLAFTTGELALAFAFLRSAGSVPWLSRAGLATRSAGCSAPWVWPPASQPSPTSTPSMG